MALYMGKVKIAGIGSGGGTGGSEHVQMTQAEYDALSASGGLTTGTIYMTPDTGSGGGGGGTCNFNLPAISSAVEDIVEENNAVIGSVVESKLTNNNSTINGYITGNNTAIGNIVDQKVVANNPAIGTVVQDKLTANNSALSSMISTIVIDTVNRTTNDIVYNSYMNANNIVNADPVRTVLADFDNVISNDLPETVCGYGPNCVLYLSDHAPIYRCFGRCSVDDFNNRVFHIESSQFSIGTSHMNEIFTKIEMPNVTLLNNKGFGGSFRHVGNCDYTVSIPKITELFANVLLISMSSSYNRCCEIFLNSISKSYFKNNYTKLGSLSVTTSPFKEGCILHLSDGDMKCQKNIPTNQYEWVNI